MNIDSSIPQPTSEELMLKYARQTRTATCFLAWIAAVLIALSAIGGVIIGISIAHDNSGGGVANCMSLGGTDPSC